jgi:hypothetical protein
MLNEENLGARVVAAYKGGSKDFEPSYSRIEGFAEQIQSKWRVELVPDIATLLSKVDGVLLLSVDARSHLAEARQVIAAHKPLFIDKPLAATLEDAREIARLAKAANVPWFSSSSLRYGAVTAGLRPGATGAIAWGPGTIHEDFPLELSWYGIHAVEVLYTILGRGCESVSRTSGPNGDTVTGRWKDGRVGAVYVARPDADYGAIVFYGKDTVEAHPKKSAASEYRPLVLQIVKFFQSGVPPVANEDTLEIFAFLDAAQRSKQQNGAAVVLR